MSATTFTAAESGRNTCKGDSGGPAFFVDSQGRYLVAGVTSHGDSACSRYGVDTRVDRNIGFVGATKATSCGYNSAKGYFSCI